MYSSWTLAPVGSVKLYYQISMGDKGNPDAKEEDK